MHPKNPVKIHDRFQELVANLELVARQLRANCQSHSFLRDLADVQLAQAEELHRLVGAARLEVEVRS